MTGSSPLSQTHVFIILNLCLSQGINTSQLECYVETARDVCDWRSGNKFRSRTQGGFSGARQLMTRIRRRFVRIRIPCPWHQLPDWESKHGQPSGSATYVHGGPPWSGDLHGAADNSFTPSVGSFPSQLPRQTHARRINNPPTAE
jgi:hypothetical protein